MSSAFTNTILTETQRRSIACGLITGVVFVSAIVVARRISGDASPAPAWLACLTGILTMGSALSCTLVPGVLKSSLDIPGRLLAFGIIAAPGLVLGLVLLPPQQPAAFFCLVSVGAVATVGGAFVGEIPSAQFRYRPAQVATVGQTESLSGESFSKPHEPDRGPELPESGLSLLSPPAVSTSPRHTEFEEHAEAFEAVPHPADQPETVQWQSRSKHGDSEQLEGGCQVSFEVGQKLAVIHLPISPPLSSAPEIECEPLDESEVLVKVAEAQRYGIRIEVTRSGALDDAITVPLGWCGFSSAEGGHEKAAA